MICHRFTAALIAGRAVEAPGIQAWDCSDLAKMKQAIRCIGSACALWARDSQLPALGRCADNTSRDCRPWPDPAAEDGGGS